MLNAGRIAPSIVPVQVQVPGTTFAQNVQRIVKDIAGYTFKPVSPSEDLAHHLANVPKVSFFLGKRNDCKWIAVTFHFGAFDINEMQPHGECFNAPTLHSFLLELACPLPNDYSLVRLTVASSALVRIDSWFCQSKSCHALVLSGWIVRYGRHVI